MWRRLIATAVALFLLPHAVLLFYRVMPPPITPLMVMRLFEGEGLHRQWVPLEDISAYLPDSVIASEDNRFCEHHGVDWQQLHEAIARYEAGEHARGASTITMQTVKNLLLWPGRDVVRKGLEIYLALYLDLIWPKRRIMEVYLNIVEWGHGIYGAEAASRHYFGRPADRLSPSEAALLAVVLPNPRVWSAGRPGPYVSERAQTIRRRVDQLGPMLDCVQVNK